MKIIALVSSGKFLAEVSDDEVAQIMGYPSAYRLEERLKPKVGSEVKVDSLFQVVTISRERKQDVVDLVDSLRKQANRLEKMNEAMAEPILTVKA